MLHRRRGGFCPPAEMAREREKAMADTTVERPRRGISAEPLRERARPRAVQGDGVGLDQLALMEVDLMEDVQGAWSRRRVTCRPASGCRRGCALAAGHQRRWHRVRQGTRWWALRAEGSPDGRRDTPAGGRSSIRGS